MKLITDYLRELGSAALTGWNRFWFSPSDPATLGFIRICTGAMLFYTHLVWSKDLLGFFGPAGRLPAEYARSLHEFNLFADSGYAWSHLYYLESPQALWICHLLALLILLLFTIGCCTRITSVLAFLITVSYAHRAVGALFGLDQINGFLALYLALGPSGAAFSVDQWWRNRRQGGSVQEQPPQLVMANVSQRLIQVHMCIVYFFAGVGKLMGQTWWAGTALWGAFANLEYQTLDLTWLAWHPIVVNVMTQLILAWEVTYPALIWPRLTRPLMLCLAIPLHLGIAIGMGMTTFGLIMLVGNAAFISPSLLRRLFSPRKQAEDSKQSGKRPAGQGAENRNLSVSSGKRRPQTQRV